MEDQNKQVASFLLSLINSNTTIAANQAENVVGAKNWLAAIAQGQLQVTQPAAPEAPPEPPKPNGKKPPAKQDAAKH